MKYFVFDISTQARRQIAYTVARIFYKLQCPSWEEGYVSQYGNEIYKSVDNKYGAIKFDETEQIPLRTNYPDGTERGKGFEHIRQWIQTRFPDGTALELTQEQKDWIKNWIINNETATFEQLILENGGTPVNLPALPNWAQVLTEAEFNALATWEQVR